MQHSPEKLLVTAKQACEMLSISRATLWRMVKAGKLTTVNVYERNTRFKYSDIVKIANGNS